jgi:hypothetical protein
VRTGVAYAAIYLVVGLGLGVIALRTRGPLRIATGAAAILLLVVTAWMVIVFGLLAALGIMAGRHSEGAQNRRYTGDRCQVSAPAARWRRVL